MESGQIKSGSTPEDTFLKMLQQVHRVTPQAADTIAGTYKSVHRLIRAFQQGGPEILEDLVVYFHIITLINGSRGRPLRELQLRGDWDPCFRKGYMRCLWGGINSR